MSSSIDPKTYLYFDNPGVDNLQLWPKSSVIIAIYGVSGSICVYPDARVLQVSMIAAIYSWSEKNILCTVLTDTITVDAFNSYKIYSLKWGCCDVINIVRHPASRVRPPAHNTLHTYLTTKQSHSCTPYVWLVYIIVLHDGRGHAPGVFSLTPHHIFGSSSSQLVSTQIQYHFCQ